MHETEPSRTALGAATYRALHQLLDAGRIFADPLALTILGADAKLSVRVAAWVSTLPGPTAACAFRGRPLGRRRPSSGTASAAASPQLVVLGDGLDTFAYRNPFEGKLAVFEVEFIGHRLGNAAGWLEASRPRLLTFTPIDFEKDHLLDALSVSGFDPARRTFFAWLGVVPYLTREAAIATLALIGGLPGGGEVVFDYSDPPGTLAPKARATQARRAARVARIGEPFLTTSSPLTSRQLTALGLARSRTWGPRSL